MAGAPSLEATDFSNGGILSKKLEVTILLRGNLVSRVPTSSCHGFLSSLL